MWPAGSARQAAYSVTAARARIASSGVAYDGTEPRPSPSAARRASGTPGMPRNVETTVLRALADAAASTSATSVSRVRSGGMNSATTESTPGSTKTSSRAAAKSSGLASGPRARVLATSRPASSQASTASTARASELPRTATRGPAGSGWVATRATTSNIMWIESARMTPARRNRASTAAAGARVPRTR